MIKLGGKKKGGKKLPSIPKRVNNPTSNPSQPRTRDVVSFGDSREGTDK
jgi:hypothetical protein